MALDRSKTGKPRNPEPDDAEVTELSVSNLDDRTHAEMRMLYAESTETLRFIKNHQWKTVGATLLTYLGLIVVAVWTKAGPAMTNKLMAITILLATAVIFTLTIYQFWMHNEMTKLDAMNPHMSSLFRAIRCCCSWPSS